MSDSNSEMEEIKKELKSAIEDDGDLEKVKSIIAQHPDLLR